MIYPADFGRSRSNGTSVAMGVRLKIWPLASRLSRSIKVIGTDTDRSATYDFLLMCRSNNHGPISYRFRDKRRFQSKIGSSHFVQYFAAPPTLSIRKLEWWGHTGPIKEVWRYIQPSGDIVEIHEPDRRTDKYTDGHRATAKTARLRIVSPGANYCTPLAKLNNPLSYQKVKEN